MLSNLVCHILNSHLEKNDTYSLILCYYVLYYIVYVFQLLFTSICLYFFFTVGFMWSSSVTKIDKSSSNLELFLIVRR